MARWRGRHRAGKGQFYLWVSRRLLGLSDVEMRDGNNYVG